MGGKLPYYVRTLCVTIVRTARVGDAPSAPIPAGARALSPGLRGPGSGPRARAPGLGPRAPGRGPRALGPGPGPRASGLGPSPRRSGPRGEFRENFTENCPHQF